MDWKDVGNIVSKAAPILGAILGGPVGAAAGGALSLAASALGVDATPEAVMQAVKDDPDALIRLRELEVQERATLLQWQTAQIQAEVEDRKAGRAVEKYERLTQEAANEDEKEEFGRKLASARRRKIQRHRQGYVLGAPRRNRYFHGLGSRLCT